MHSRPLLFAKIVRWLALCVLALGALGVHARAMPNAPLEKIASQDADCAPVRAAQVLDSTQENSPTYGACTSWGIYMGVDPKGFDEANIHSFNRYTYANNNPYRYVDPDGRSAALAATGLGILVIGGTYYALAPPSKQQEMRESIGRLSRAIGNALHSESAESSKGADKPSLLDPKGEDHVLDGDGPNAGGGHRNGTGKSGKSEFPAGWSDSKITGEISDVATDPGSTRTTQPNGRIKVVGTRDGVDITVIVEPGSRGGRIVTGFPTNTPRNP